MCVCGIHPAAADLLTCRLVEARSICTFQKGLPSVVLDIRLDTDEQWMVSEETKNQVRQIQFCHTVPTSPSVRSPSAWVTALGCSGHFDVLESVLWLC